LFTQSARWREAGREAELADANSPISLFQKEMSVFATEAVLSKPDLVKALKSDAMPEILDKLNTSANTILGLFSLLDIDLTTKVSIDELVHAIQHKEDPVDVLTLMYESKRMCSMISDVKALVVKLETDA